MSIAFSYFFCRTSKSTHPLQGRCSTKGLKVKLIINELAPINHKPKDWVGLYKKGKSNDWGNVIKWTWANAYVPNNDDEDGPTLSFGQVNLADGEYEVRYFLKNSFTTYMSADFKVQ